MHTMDHDTSLLVMTPGATEPNELNNLKQSCTKKEIQRVTKTILMPLIRPEMQSARSPYDVLQKILEQIWDTHYCSEAVLKTLRSQMLMDVAVGHCCREGRRRHIFYKSWSGKAEVLPVTAS